MPARIYSRHWLILPRSCGALLIAFAICGGIPSAAAIAQAQVQSASSAWDLGHLAPLPPMGWASWNHFFCDYDERTIRAEADALVSTGMRDLGYKYILIQECIAPSRDRSGNLVADPMRFPHGMKALTAYIHAHGLKAGIYTDVGPYTCFPRPRYQGSFGHEEEDARTFAAWGMDLVEMDYCNKPASVAGRKIYERMGRAIHNAGRPMVFYICSWGNERPWEWAQGTAQMWRTDFDISLEKNRVEWSRMLRNFESNATHAVFNAPESWNDADMLEIGIPGLSQTEQRTHFSMWAISGAPLLAGADLTRLDDATREIFTNREAVAVDQDALGAGPRRVSGQVDGVEVWSKALESPTSGVQAVLLVNEESSPAVVSVRWAQLGLKEGVKVRDLWLHKDLGRFADGYRTQIAPHGSRLLKVSGSFDWAKGAVIEAEWPENVRRGGAKLFECGECSRGFGVRLGGIDGLKSGSLTIPLLNIPAAGQYHLELTYVRNGLSDKQIRVQVNGRAAIHVTALMRAWNWVTVPVSLRAGDNTVTVGDWEGNASNGAFDDTLNLDKIRLTK